MCLRNGEPASGLDFFNLLREDDDFCAELGRAVLAAGRLESALARYINKHAPGANTTNATLGRLINFARANELLFKLVPALESLKDQRNYLTHNIHALFSGLVEETVLASTGLLDSDVDLFTGRASQLKENLNDLADIVFENL